MKTQLCYESNSGERLHDPSLGELSQALERVDGVDNAFASLTVSGGTYIQVAGGPSEFVVEVREVDFTGGYRHLRAFYPDGVEKPRLLSIGGKPLEVNSNEIVDIGTVKDLFASFAQGAYMSRSVQWEDITSLFD